jgi:hypothetical protein
MIKDSIFSFILLIMTVLISSCNSISEEELGGLKNKIREIGDSQLYKFEAKYISKANIGETLFKLVQVKYTYPSAPQPRQCVYVLYHYDEEAGMLTDMTVGSVGYGGCDINRGCFGCRDKTFAETMKQIRYSGDIEDL